MKIQTDKLQHFGVCAITAFLVTTIGNTCVRNQALWPLVGFSFAMGLGIGKEYGDSNASGNKWCWWDLLADTLGSIVGTLLSYLVTLALK